MIVITFGVPSVFYVMKTMSHTEMQWIKNVESVALQDESVAVNACRFIYQTRWLATAQLIRWGGLPPIMLGLCTKCYTSNVTLLKNVKEYEGLFFCESCTTDSE